METYALLLFLAGPIVSLLLFLWMIALTSRLADIRTEARKQTKLLEEIAAQGRTATPPRVESTVRYR